MGVFARNETGYFVSSNTHTEINQEEAPIFYIDLNENIHYLGKNLRHFIRALLQYPVEFKKIWSFPFVNDEEREYLYSFFGKKKVIQIKKEDIPNHKITIYPTLEEAKNKYVFV